MTIAILLVVFIVVTIVFTRRKKDSYSKSTTESVEVGSVAQGPIVHDLLSEEQLGRIASIQETFSEVYPVSLEETIENFKRDHNPDNEIGVWLNMANAYSLFAREHSDDQDLEIRKEAFKLLLMRSMMPENEAVNSFALNYLNQNQIEQILSTYNLEAKPLVIKTNK